MEENRLDNIFKEKLSSFELDEQIPDVWAGVSSGLASRRRWRTVRRISYAAVAAAACLILGVVLFKDKPAVAPAAPEAPVQIAQAAPEQPETASPVLDETPTMQQQIDRLAARGVLAAARPAAGAHTAIADPTTPEQPAAAQDTVEVPLMNTDTLKYETYSPVPVPEEAMTPSKPADDDFWFEDESPKRTHTSQLSILSNFASFSSAGRLSGGGGAEYAGGPEGSAQASSGVQIEGEPKFYMPLTVGLQLRTRLSGDFYVGAGVNYTYLVSKYDALVDKVAYKGVHNQQHYIGIPVKFYYDFTGSERWSVYASLGGAVEKCVGNRTIYGSNTLTQKVSGVQFSAMAGVGVEYWFAPKFGIYFDPSLAYYFKSDQPLSIRTQQPLQAKLEAGFRFNL